MHKKNRLLALFMTIALLFSSVSFAVSAEEAPAVRVSEVESLRETNAETYLMSDGSYECVVYAYDKYYKAPDNTLQLTSSKIVPATGAERSGKLSSGKNQYKNAANAFDVHFSGSGAPEVSIAYQDAAVTFSPLAAEKNTAGTTFSLGKVTGCEPLDKLTSTGENTVTYNTAFPNTDLIYVLENNALKEYIILNSITAGNTFSFQFSLDGVKLQSKDNYAEFIDQNGIVLFSLDSLFAVDANGAFTDKLKYTFEPIKDSNNIIVTVTLDKAYFSSAERVFPIIIDPTIMISSTETADACVCSYTPNTNYRLDAKLRTGMDDEYGIRRSFIKFNIPDTIPEGSVTSARIEMEKTSGATPTVKAYQCVSNWSSSTITWRNMPDDPGNFALESTTSIPISSGSSWYAMYVTEIVQEWIDGVSPNYGFILMDDEEGLTEHWTTWYSSDAASPHKPELYITYIEPEVEDPDPDAEDPEPDEPDPDPDDPEDENLELDPNEMIPLIRLYSVTMSDHNNHSSVFTHNDKLQEVKNLFDSHGYTDNAFQTGYFVPDTFKHELLNTAIVTTFSHGYHWNYGIDHSTGLLLNESTLDANDYPDDYMDDWWLFMSTDYRDTTDDPNVTYNKFASVNDYDDFSDLKLAVFVGCETATDSENEGNLAYQIVNQGAYVSVGFNTVINCADAINWVKIFYDYLFDGYTVGRAASEAAKDVGPSITNNNCKVYGATTATLDDLL